MKNNDRRVVVVNKNMDSKNELKVEDNMLVRRALFGKKVLELCKRRNLFRTHCKS